MRYGSLNGTSSLNNSLAADAQSLGKLKMDAGNSTPESIKETAKQFESLFMKELIKSMRDANAAMKSGMNDNAGSDLGSDLLDQQFAVQMSGQPGGLSDLIAAQLTRQMGAAKEATAAAESTTSTTKTGSKGISPTDPARNVGPLGRSGKAPTAGQIEFVNKLSDAAAKAEQASGIPASYMLGQAGHETA